ncbi:alpha/beta fold hydrolase [Nocardioides sp. YIM 152315]|uniref:lipase family alpha/beta hydrolase n=1 Tax=Nocardioides sp. YIM 152315 TaxID=3031760 RepID=UPI0023DCD5F5|nr:alpha/beta fold hydrolase [Nocardioides sp. YIM 152315]MDF1606083.1 alpha/beta fold hydrolase [Nocardioides sp. YIM 152315]
MAVLDSLSPARRRLVLGVGALILALGAVVLVAVMGGRDGRVDPVAQDRPGPVLLVPGYGGSTGALQVLADALADQGHDTQVVKPAGSGTQDLRDQAADLGEAVDAALAETGAPSVDLVGYSAGGVVVRLYVADLDGGSHVRRAVTLASPHHGTELAALAKSLGGTVCPEACQQLDPDSDLLRRLNAGDETPPGPAWVALWTEDDETVVPPDSGSLEGALDISLQEVCPGLGVRHRDVPRSTPVVAIVEAVLGIDQPAVPASPACTS